MTWEGPGKVRVMRRELRLQRAQDGKGLVVVQGCGPPEPCNHRGGMVGGGLAGVEGSPEMWWDVLRGRSPW